MKSNSGQKGKLFVDLTWNKEVKFYSFAISVEYQEASGNV